MNTSLPQGDRVVIVGAGFGGMQVACSLANSNAEVILIDRNNFHTFVPLLYQVATGQIEAETIAYPIRTLFRRAKNVRFFRDEVQSINFETQQIKTQNFTLPYDYLVMATGSQTRPHPSAGQHLWSMRTLPEAIALRNHIMNCFEQAASESCPERLQKLLTFAIVGGGATGVELAGALVELLQGPVKRDYPSIALTQVRLYLMQSGPVLLPDLPFHLGQYTAKKLHSLGVKVCLDTRVNDVQPGQIILANGSLIASDTVIWAAGMQPDMPQTSPQADLSRKGKLAVLSTLQVEEYPNVYGIGDVAHVQSKTYSLTGVAPEALQQGVHVACNIKRQLHGKTPLPFKYLNKGRLAIIGCFSGVGKVGPVAFSGVLAWFMWLAVHLVYLPGFRNRLMILMSWLHAYGFGDRAVRQIVPPAVSTLKPTSLPLAQTSVAMDP
ncbi:MAG: NAD(P)/FAD-dependent oxidoreductase [Cyanobacteria bacterium P01_F01_bin.150]